jgi:ribose/xylose/arabinose/galactoside ABC-type transport system permease subunit
VDASSITAVRAHGRPGTVWLALSIGEFDLSFVAVADLVGVLVTSFGWTSSFGIAGALVLGLVCGAAPRPKPAEFGNRRA